MRIEVVFALPGAQQVVTVELEAGATARDAVRAAGLTAQYAALGIFGSKVDLATALRDGDRVEILRPLAEDPKEARRRRARRR